MLLHLIFYIFVEMSKLLSIPLSILILFQSFNIHMEDVLKLKEVIVHFQLHKERYGDGIIVFISKHYGNLKESHKQQHQEEEKEHHHPPIHHDCSTQISSVFVLLVHSFYIERPTNDVEKTTNFYYQDKFSTFEKSTIFQPPKLA